MVSRVLAPETLTALENLASWASAGGFYLAGGTGCALHLGHRMSRDLDFFRLDAFAPSDLWASLRRLGECSPDYTDAGTWVGEFMGTKTGFFHYPYPLLGPLVSFSGLAVASLEDIGCMKVEAIAGRGRKRDFVDLFFILRETGFDLEALLELFRKKYASRPNNGIHVLKSLAFFDDADADPDPLMLADFSWAEIKRTLTGLVRKIEI